MVADVVNWFDEDAKAKHTTVEFSTKFKLGRVLRNHDRSHS
jgi:hypothetical protein